MAHYAIGDVQGCNDDLLRLLEAISFDAARDQLWLVGDLVNRGPQSLEVLRQVRDFGSSAHVVLGNHDLHLLASAAGTRSAARHDTFDDVLAAPDRAVLLQWLRQQRMAYRQTVHGTDYLMVHAGIAPQWSFADALARASEVELALAGDRWAEFMAHLYGNEPDRWDEALSGWDRLRAIVNVLTRLRFCRPDGTMDLVTKEGAGSAPEGYAPWFRWRDSDALQACILFGHWSMLGLVANDQVVGLDSGCVWGGSLTAIRLEDRQVIQVRCRQHQRPG
jgi:bis(5'-nucleosyl)-tetraphosphatase (symmetrical)